LDNHGIVVNPYLVGGFNHLEKYEFVNGKDDIPYMKWNINFMFQTTNQQFHKFHRHLLTLGQGSAGLGHSLEISAGSAKVAKKPGKHRPFHEIS